jgi:DNA polymerase-3 subunit chi
MDIYFVETTAAEQRGLVCRWTERFYTEKKRVQILVDSMAAAQFVDQLLWTFSQSSFIPHLILGPAGAPPAEPVVITSGEFQVAGFEAVICDCPAGLEFMSRFETAVHFVIKDDPARTQQSRLLWQRARDSGIRPVHVPYGPIADLGI